MDEIAFMHNRLTRAELDYDINVLKSEHGHLFSMLNENWRVVYDSITDDLQ